MHASDEGGAGRSAFAIAAASAAAADATDAGAETAEAEIAGSAEAPGAGLAASCDPPLPFAADAATRVVAVRHGETAWNVDHRIQGQLDVALNERGRWQAERAAAALAGEGIDLVYASDLARAWDTGRAIAAAAGCGVVADAGLRERHFGAFEGSTYDEIGLRWPEAALRWRRREADFGPEGGETLAAFYDRCIDAATRLAARHAGQTIALVAHGGVLDCLYRAATRIALDAPRTWQVGNASINRLLYTQGGFILVGWSDVQHLEDVPPRGSGDAP